MDSYQNTLYSPTESLIASFKINKAQASDFLKLEMEFQIVKDQLKRAQKTIFELEKKEAITFKFNSIITDCINQLPNKYKVKIRDYLNKQNIQYQNQKQHSQNNNSIQQDINTLIQKLSSFSSMINASQQQISLDKQDQLYHQTYSETKGSPSQKKLEKLQQENDMLKLKLAKLESQQCKISKDSTCKNSDISIPVLTQMKNIKDFRNDSDILNKINTLQSSNILSDYQDVSKELQQNSHQKENQNQNMNSNLILDEKAMKDTVDILSLFRKNELKTSEIINHQRFYDINNNDFNNIELAKESDYYLKSSNNLKSLNDSSLNEEPKLQTDLLKQFNKVSNSQYQQNTENESEISDISKIKMNHFDRVQTKPRCSEQISEMGNLDECKKFFKTIDTRDQYGSKNGFQKQNNNLYRKYFESFRGHTNKENQFDKNLNFMQKRSSSIDVIEINKLINFENKNIENKLDQKKVPLKKHFIKNILRKQQSQEMICKDDLMKKKTSRKRQDQQHIRKKLSINEQRKKLPFGKKGLKKSSGNNKKSKKCLNNKKVSNFQDLEENQYFSRNSNISDKKLKKVLQIKKFNQSSFLIDFLIYQHNSSIISFQLLLLSFYNYFQNQFIPSIEYSNLLYYNTSLHLSIKSGNKESLNIFADVIKPLFTSMLISTNPKDNFSVNSLLNYGHYPSTQFLSYIQFMLTSISGFSCMNFQSNIFLFQFEPSSPNYQIKACVIPSIIISALMSYYISFKLMTLAFTESIPLLFILSIFGFKICCIILKSVSIKIVP